MENITNKVLDDAKDKFDNLIVIGVKDNKMDILATISQYPWLQHTIHKASFELFIHEKENTNKPVVVEE